MSTVYSDFLAGLTAEEQRVLLQIGLAGLKDPLISCRIAGEPRGFLTEKIAEQLRFASEGYSIILAKPGGKAGKNPKSKTIQVREYLNQEIYLLKAQFRYDPASRESFHQAVARAAKWLKDYTGFEVAHSVKHLEEIERRSNCLLRSENGKRPKPHSNRKR